MAKRAKKSETVAVDICIAYEEIVTFDLPVDHTPDDIEERLRPRKGLQMIDWNYA